MMTPLKTKTLIFPLLSSLMIVATLLWPAQALADEPICRSELPGLPIPDSLGRDEPGDTVTSTLIVTNEAFINDLNITISATHPYVGDLVFTLTHKINSIFTSTEIVRQPLKGQSVITQPHEVSCTGDDIFVTLDDEALLDIQVNCTEGSVHNDGTKAYLNGQSYKPYNPLSIFDTDTLSGTWELTITDNYQEDSGELLGWCLVPNVEGDLQIQKSALPAQAVQGQPLTYTISYKNLGTSQIATGVVITDIIPLYLTNPTFNSSGPAITRTSGITYEWQVADLAPGEAGVITVAGTLSPEAIGGTNFVNTAVITTTSIETNTTNNASDATVSVRRPDLQLSKADGGLTPIPGDLITYTLTYTNSGGSTTGVVITEAVPTYTSFNAGSPGWQQVGATSQYTYSAGNLNINEGGVITFAVRIDDSLPPGVDSITNIAQISDDGANGLDQNLGDNTSQINTPVHAAPDLVITKTDEDITVTPSSLITYTLIYTNKGDQDAIGAVITETVPAHTSFNAGSPGWQQVGATSQYTYNIGSLGVGASQSITFVVTVNSFLPAGVDAVANTAQISDDEANGVDKTPADNTGNDTTPIVAVPDLTIGKSDGGITATPGSFITYTLTYTNKGNQDATGVVITETLPTHTSFNPARNPGWQQVGITNQYIYSIGNLNIGPSQAISFIITVANPLPTGINEITNTVTIGDDGTNGVETSGNNTANEMTPVVAAPDLVITKTDGGLSTTPGGLITYTLTYTNEGNQDATGVVITETLPSNTSFNAAASSSGWQQVGSTQQYTRSVGSLSSSQGGQVATFVVTVNNPLSEGVSTITNTVQIGGSVSEQDLSDNQADEVTPVTTFVKLYLPIILR